MGYIYKITNLINGKIYIGQTKSPINIRMNRHYSRANICKNITGIDAAIKKYGKNNFSVEIIEECDNNRLDEREIFFISKLNSFSKNGYNLNKGGQIKKTYLNLNEEQVINTYKKYNSIKETSKFYNCCPKTISNILHNNNIEIQNLSYGSRIENLKNAWGKGSPKKPIKIIELNKNFNSIKECSEWLLENGYSNAKTVKLTSKSICRVLSKQRNSYCGFHFNYI